MNNIILIYYINIYSKFLSWYFIENITKKYMHIFFVFIW